MTKEIKEVTAQEFLTQVIAGVESFRDTISTVGVMSGIDVPYRYNVVLKREDGSRYEIHIK